MQAQNKWTKTSQASVFGGKATDNRKDTKEFYQQVLKQLLGSLKNHYRNRCYALSQKQIQDLQQRVKEWLMKPEQLFEAANHYAQSTTTRNPESTSYTFQVHREEEGIEEIAGNYFSENINHKIRRINEIDRDIDKNINLQTLKIDREQDMIKREQQINTCRIKEHHSQKQTQATQTSIQEIERGCSSPCPITTTQIPTIKIQVESENSDQDEEEEEHFDLPQLDYRVAALYQNERRNSKKQKWQLNLEDIFEKSRSGQYYIGKAKAELVRIEKMEVAKWNKKV